MAISLMTSVLKCMNERDRELVIQGKYKHTEDSENSCQFRSTSRYICLWGVPRVRMGIVGQQLMDTTDSDN
jgi:hypothetical protein